MQPRTIGNRPALVGAECSFIKMDNGWGLKLYDELSLAEHTHYMQGYASSYGLAPRVGKNVFKFDKQGHTVHAYYTECIAKLLYDALPDLGNWLGGNWPKSNEWGICGCCVDCPSLCLPDIAQQLADIGIKPYDLNYGNLGWMPDGRFVCIDFGLCEWA